jgi:site-specific DNA recombinase
MAEPRRKGGPLQIHVAYSLDRLLEPKLAHAYEILVPGRERPVGVPVKEFENENGGDLRKGFVRAATRGAYDCEPDGVADEFAKSHDLEVPQEWVFEEEGYSGAMLERPGLERVRDLAAEGQIQVVLAYSPDRLSRKYAYQILLIEEFARLGVETVFVKPPQGDSAEDQLLVQFQGMIAEYERAQILERSRRGKRHRAQAGEVSVMSGAPYGYHYLRKTDDAPAAYVVDKAEAEVVRRVYEMYTVEGLSIGEITRRLNREGVPTRKAGRWERSVVWGVLRNPAYRGVVCFGKTRISARTRVLRPQRRRGVTMPSTTASHERPREEWREIPVPALVTEESFARAQELLQQNKIRSRRTITPSVVQGLVSCAKCGYALSRTSTQTSARKIHYHKCIGSESWRKLGGPVCDNGRFVRQELLDQIVWAEVIRLLEEPALIQQELDRRLFAARASDPTRKREQGLQQELTHVGKGIERLLNADQEGLLSLEQLRERMPALRHRQQTLRAELQAIADQTNDRAAFLRLAETLTAFLARLRSAAETLSVLERQRIVRLLVKEVLVGEDTITIRHSIPIPPGPRQSGGSEDPNGPNYLLCKGRDFATAVEPRARRTRPRASRYKHVAVREQRGGVGNSCNIHASGLLECAGSKTEDGCTRGQPGRSNGNEYESSYELMLVSADHKKPPYLPGRARLGRFRRGRTCVRRGGLMELPTTPRIPSYNLGREICTG